MSFANPDYGHWFQSRAARGQRAFACLRSLVRTIGKGIRNDKGRQEAALLPQPTERDGYRRKRPARRSQTRKLQRNLVPDHVTRCLDTGDVQTRPRAREETSRIYRLDPVSPYPPTHPRPWRGQRQESGRSWVSHFAGDRRCANGYVSYKAVTEATIMRNCEAFLRRVQRHTNKQAVRAWPRAHDRAP
jgi:hypothetical protein